MLRDRKVRIILSEVNKRLLVSVLIIFISILIMEKVECSKKSSSRSAISKRGISSITNSSVLYSPLVNSKNNYQTKQSSSKGKRSRVSNLHINDLTDLNSTSTSSSLVGKSSQGKQSWLAVASAVAHSAASDAPHIPIGDDISKPTKYHYYPHNQHLYLLPECATQQVCSAVYLRLNYSQPLCACPNAHQPCSVSTRTDDRHTIPLVTGSYSQALTLVKTCEPTQEVRECRAPKDWSILALQNSRTGKAHYLVICRCPSPGFLEGPIAHSQPAYARVPGIRVYGMTCVRFPNRTGREERNLSEEKNIPRGPNPSFPWHKLKNILQTTIGLVS